MNLGVLEGGFFIDVIFLKMLFFLKVVGLNFLKLRIFLFWFLNLIKVMWEFLGLMLMFFDILIMNLSRVF